MEIPSTAGLELVGDAMIGVMDSAVDEVPK